MQLISNRLREREKRKEISLRPVRDESQEREMIEYGVKVWI